MTCDNPKIDRVQLIQRSIRCFYYGLIGLIPIIGLVMAVLGIRLYHRVIKEANEKPAHPPRWGRVLFLYGICWSAFTLSSLVDVPLWLLTICLFCAFQVFLWRMQYWPVTSTVWNPARSYLFWGYQFGVSGLFGSLFVTGAALFAFMFSQR